MVNAQIINPFNDTVMIFDGYNVIRDSDQKEIGRELSIETVQIDINLWDLMTNSNSSVSNIVMTYHSEVDHWTVDLTDVGILIDKHKFVGKVSEYIPASAGMRDFKILEFTVYHDDLENTLFSLPYEIVISDGTASFIWYEDGYIGDINHALYIASAFEGGVGEVYATHPSRVTHRGAVHRYMVVEES
jgi:hypothetical protein